MADPEPDRRPPTTDAETKPAKFLALDLAASTQGFQPWTSPIFSPSSSYRPVM
jgi:hypothetical protein